MSATTVSIYEFVLLACAATFSWAASITFLWPVVFLLKLALGLRNRLSSYAWTKYYCENRSLHLREKMFEMLRENCPQYDTKKLKILEVGTWCENNIDFYSDHHVVSAAYRNVECFKFQRQNLFPENIRMRDVKKVLNTTPDETYDIVVSSFHLCSVMNVDNTLKEVKRILKPGGKFAFLEHVGFPENQLTYSMQRLVTPFWTILFDNCRLDRHVTKNLHQSSFTALTYQTFYPENRTVFHRPVAIGLCTK